MDAKDTRFRRAAARAKPYKLGDRDGLFLLVRPNGSKWWRLKYRVQGKEKLLSLGVYPRVSLAQARKDCAAARAQLALGHDPSELRKESEAQKKIAAASTFKAIGDEWLEKMKGEHSASTNAKAEWMLTRYAYPSLGRRELTAISPTHILAVLQAMESAGKLETMHRLRARISEVFRYAIAAGRAQSDPTRDLKGAVKAKPKTQHHAALIVPKDVGALMQCIHTYRGTPVTFAALRLAPLLFVRPGELRRAEWHQFELDGPSPSWRFHVAKTGTDHVVPLCDQALVILRELQTLTGGAREVPDGLPQYLFPGVRTRARPMSENTINAALKRLGYDGDQMTGHGFRAMARTLLAELGWRPDAIERQLAHKASGPLKGAYDRAEFLSERRQMMQAWADYLDQLRLGKSKVVPIRGAVA